MMELITEIADRGFLFNNLFQLSPTQWQCNLRNATHATGFGLGSSPTVAIEAALASVERFELIAQTTVGVIAANPPSLSSLLRITQGKVYRR